MEQLREEKIDEVQPVVPRSSVPWAVVIEVAFTTLAPPVWLEPITKSIPSVCEEPGPPSLDFLYLDSFHQLSNVLCQSLRRERIRSIEMRRSRATFSRRVLLAVVLLAVIVVALLAWVVQSKKPRKRNPTSSDEPSEVSISYFDTSDFDTSDESSESSEYWSLKSHQSLDLSVLSDSSPPVALGTKRNLQLEEKSIQHRSGLISTEKRRHST